MRETQRDLASDWEPVGVGGAGRGQAGSQSAVLGTRALIPSPDSQGSPCIPLDSSPASETGAWARRLPSALPHPKHFSICLPTSLGAGRLGSGTLYHCSSRPVFKVCPVLWFPLPNQMPEFCWVVGQLYHCSSRPVCPCPTPN